MPEPPWWSHPTISWKLPCNASQQIWSLMSPKGQSRRFDPLLTNSGLPRTTDISKPTPMVRFVPTRDSCAAAIGALFNHLVGEQQEFAAYC
jgi:hypothetical protein